MRTVFKFMTLTHSDPMKYIYPLYRLFLCLAIVGVILEVPGVWGTGLAAFCLVGLLACWVTIRQAKIQNTHETGDVEKI
jgi:hypothetical protein